MSVAWVAVGVSAVVGVASAASSANAQKSAAKKAANAQGAASDAQIALTREQMDRAMALAAPYQARGNQADARSDALWSNPAPNTRLASTLSRPGGAYGPSLSPVQSIYGGTGSPLLTTALPGGPSNIPQVGMPPLPAAAPPAAPPAPPSWLEGFSYVPSVQLPVYAPPAAPGATPNGGGVGVGAGGVRPSDLQVDIYGRPIRPPHVN